MNCHPRVSTDWDLFASGGSLLFCAWPGRVPAPHLVAVHSRADRQTADAGRLGGVARANFMHAASNSPAPAVQAF